MSKHPDVILRAASTSASFLTRAARQADTQVIYYLISSSFHLRVIVTGQQIFEIFLFLLFWNDSYLME